mmetsp:Transcript_39547/g.124385  ORF Transcript_39547/g.124385 Transcript_39547/m.124385 type:complete len:107 (-) Transcript_39547:34-354(-)
MSTDLAGGFKDVKEVQITAQSIRGYQEQTNGEGEGGDDYETTGVGVSASRIRSQKSKEPIHNIDTALGQQARHKLRYAHARMLMLTIPPFTMSRQPTASTGTGMER